MTIDHFEIFIVKPKASTNLCTNPSFELGTTGWSTAGSNTIVRSGEQQRRGLYSLKCTYQNSLTMAYITSITLTAAKHWFALDIYVPSNFDADELKIDFNSFTGATGTLVASVDLTKKDQWQRVYVDATIVSGDLTGLLRLVTTTGNEPTAGRYVYIDGVQVEVGDEPTTYFDGDSEGFTDESNEHWWETIKHGSKSYRSSFSQAGGELIPISDYCKRIGIYGLGMSPVTNVSLPITDGSKLYEYSKLLSRYFSIKISFTDLTVGAIDAKRLALLQLLNPANIKFNQPILLKFIGYDSNGVEDSKIVNVKCSYVSGLDQSPQTNKPYVTDITFEMFDQFMTIEGDIAVALDTTGSITPYGITCIRNNGEGFAPNGIGMTWSGNWQKIKQNPITNEVWFAGDFINFDGDSTLDYLVKFAGFDVATEFVKPTSGTAPNGIVRDITFDYTGRAFIVGEFTGISGTATNYIGRINADGSVTAITGLPSASSSVYLSKAGYIMAGCGGGIYSMLYYNTALSLMTSTYTDVQIIKEDNSGVLYFYNNADKKIYYDSNGLGTYVAIGTFNDKVYDFTFDEKNTLIAVGEFTTIDGVSSDHLAFYDGSVWTPFLGINSAIHVVQVIDGKLLLGGRLAYYNQRRYANIVWYDKGFIRPLPLFTTAAGIFKAMLYDKSGHLWGWGDAITPVVFGGLNLINNSGNVVYPKFRFRNESTAIWHIYFIHNQTTKKLISIDYEAIRGYEEVIIDTKNAEIAYKNVIGVDRKSDIIPGSDADFYLVNGENRLFVGANTDITNAFLIYNENISSLDGWLR